MTREFEGKKIQNEQCTHKPQIVFGCSLVHKFYYVSLQTAAILSHLERNVRVVFSAATTTAVAVALLRLMCVFIYKIFSVFSCAVFFLLAFISFHFIHTIFCSFVSVDFNPIQLQLIECSHQTSKLTLLCIFKFAATFTFFFSLLLYVYSVFSARLN